MVHQDSIFKENALTVDDNSLGVIYGRRNTIITNTLKTALIFLNISDAVLQVAPM